MSEKVLCPYCGEEMVFWDFYTAVMIGGSFKCEKCHSYSPYGQLSRTVEEAKKNAIYAAKCRYQPENRVLTLEEVKEHYADPYMIPHWVESDIHSLNHYLEYDFMRAFLESDFACDMYGKTWRCWLRKPTDAERKAVEWE